MYVLGAILCLMISGLGVLCVVIITTFSLSELQKRTMPLKDIIGILWVLICSICGTIMFFKFAIHLLQTGICK